MSVLLSSSSDLLTLKFTRGLLGLFFLGPLEVDSTGLDCLFLAFSGSGVDALRTFD